MHFWPFDDWEIPPDRLAIVEAYPSLYRNSFAPEGRTLDQHDAYAIAAWLQQIDLNGQLVEFLSPNLTLPERGMADLVLW